MSENENISKLDIKAMFKQAQAEAEARLDTPLHRLTQKILNEERKYLFSDQGNTQRKKSIREFIEEARKSGDDFSY